MTSSNNDKILFVLSIDTEEEWNWAHGFPSKDFDLKNIQLLPEFQNRCANLGIVPTYLIDYAVADDSESVRIINEIQNSSEVELAAHLHPWCNPPMVGETFERESHVVNLALDLVEQKLDSLTNKITQAFGVKPVSFRTGRWGINGEILKLLNSYGYKVDSSVYPFYKNQYFDCYGKQLLPYWPSYDNELELGEQRDIFEIPVTVGYNQKDFFAADKLHQKLSAPPFSLFRTIGLAWHFGFFKKLYMCPELCTGEEMISLTETVLENDYPIVHMYMHSSSLLPGATGFVEGDNPAEEIISRIEKVIEYLASKKEIEFCTLANAFSSFVGQPAK